MITMFETTRETWHPTEIMRVDVSRRTEKSVWINGRRRARTSDWSTYHDTWEDARNHLLEFAERSRDAFSKRLDEQISIIQKLREMEEHTS